MHLGLLIKSNAASLTSLKNARMILRYRVSKRIVVLLLRAVFFVQSCELFDGWIQEVYKQYCKDDLLCQKTRGMTSNVKIVVGALQKPSESNLSSNRIAQGIVKKPRKEWVMAVQQLNHDIHAESRTRAISTTWGDPEENGCCDTQMMC